MEDRDAARAAKDGLRHELAPVAGVNGFGIGRREGRYVVTVMVAEASLRALVPDTYDGVHVEIRVTGSVRALPVLEPDQAPPETDQAPPETDQAPTETGGCGPGSG